MSGSSNLLLVGLPGTGKTTFIAALDQCLEEQKDPAGLQSSRFAHDRTYLDRIKAAWLKGEEMPRTNPGDNTAVRLHASDPASSTQVELYLPDTLGEVYRRQCEDREWSQEFRARLSQTQGVLLCVSCAQEARHEPIRQIKSTGDTGGTEKKAVTPWEKKHAMPQTKVVELLQFMAEKGGMVKPIRIAVLLTAWDIVLKGGNRFPQDPAEYLRTQWPLLDQFLKMNPEPFSFKPYGVSALGGQISDKSRLEKESPTERIILVDGAARSHDLTRPVKWLVNL